MALDGGTMKTQLRRPGDPATRRPGDLFTVKGLNAVCQYRSVMFFGAMPKRLVHASHGQSDPGNHPHNLPLDIVL